MLDANDIFSAARLVHFGFIGQVELCHKSAAGHPELSQSQSFAPMARLAWESLECVTGELATVQ